MEIYMSNELRSAMKSQFRLASKEVCKPKAEYQEEYQQEEKGNTKSYAQVENLVLPPNSGALKREGIPSGVTRSRPNPLTIRLSEKHKEIIRSKAQAAGIIERGVFIFSAINI